MKIINSELIKEPEITLKESLDKWENDSTSVIAIIKSGFVSILHIFDDNENYIFWAFKMLEGSCEVCYRSEDDALYSVTEAIQEGENVQFFADMGELIDYMRKNKIKF